MSRYIVDEVKTSTIAYPNDTSKKLLLNHSDAAGNTSTTFKFDRTINQDLHIPDTVGSDTFITKKNVANTGSGTSVYNDTDNSASTLHFKKLNAASNKLSISSTSDTINLDVVTGSVDHNSLANLTVGDAHPQYFRTDGTRNMTGNINMNTNSITNVNLINSIDIAAHASRHAPNGADPLPTGTAVSIGTANSQGTATTFVRSDHVHQGIHSISANGGTQRFGDQTFQQGFGINITDNGSGTFTIANSGNGTAELVVSAGAGLIANYTAGRVMINGTITNIVAGSITLTASISNGTIYVSTAGTVTKGTSFPANTVPLATYITAISSITSITDSRVLLNDNAQFGLAANISNITSTATASAGILDQAARVDHVHTISTLAPISQTPDQSNALGSSTSLARSDHVHNIATATPVSIGSTNSQGSATTFVKSDHVHQGIHSINANGGTQRYGDITLQQGSNVTITDNGAGTITVASSVTPPLVNILTDQKASGTAGGTFTKSIWMTRTLNTITGNGTVTLLTNQFTMNAGTYIIDARTPAYRVDKHQCRLFNVTDNVAVDYGLNATSTSELALLGTAATTAVSHLNTYLVLAAQKVMRIEHRCQTTEATDGFGQAGSFGNNEVYCTVMITKIA